MKRTSITLFIAVVCCALIYSCKKDKGNTPPVIVDEDEVRLQIVEVKSPGGIYKYSLEYDAEGRISKIAHQSQTSPSSALFNVNYSADAIEIARPAYTSPSVDIYDTIRMSLDADRNITQRIQYRYVISKTPQGNSGKTYIFDTTSFEYNGSGFVISMIHNLQDSVWSKGNGGSPDVTKVIRKSTVTDYAVEGNLLTALSKLTSVSEVIYEGQSVVMDNRTEEANLTFEYTKEFPNKTDFSNAAVLNELHQFTDLPLNKKYSFLPDKVHAITQKKDKDGVVYHSTDTYTNNEFTFNSYGFVNGKSNPAIPGTKVSYWYNW